MCGLLLSLYVSIMILGQIFLCVGAARGCQGRGRVQGLSSRDQWSASEGCFARGCPSLLSTFYLSNLYIFLTTSDFKLKLFVCQVI